MIPSVAVLDSPPDSGGAGWAVLQLVETAAFVAVTTIERDLLRHAPPVAVFFPAITVEGLPSPLHPLSSYAFTRADQPDHLLVALERSRYVESVLRNGRKVARVSDDDLHKALRSKVREARIEVGQTVLVLAGDWAGIEGKVSDVRSGRVTVLVELRSTRTLVKVAAHEIQFL